MPCSSSSSPSSPWSVFVFLQRIPTVLVLLPVLVNEDPFQISRLSSFITNLTFNHNRSRVALRLEQTECPPVYGRVMVFVMYVQSSLDK